jgi:hypothetical protein
MIGLFLGHFTPRYKLFVDQSPKFFAGRRLAINTRLTKGLPHEDIKEKRELLEHRHSPMSSVPDY